MTLLTFLINFLAPKRYNYSQAGELESICNGEIQMTFRYKTSTKGRTKVLQYDTSTKLNSLDQPSKSQQLPSQPEQNRTKPDVNSILSDFQTPTKKRTLGNTQLVSSAPQIINLPRSSKKKELVLSKTPFSPNINRCPVCKVVFESEEDLALKDRVGKAQYRWIGCDVKECEYWGRAGCLMPFEEGNNQRKLKSIPFKCPEHK